MTDETPDGLSHATVSALLESLASKTPTPGGGAVAALLAALGAATAQMTLNYSIGRKKLAEHAALHTTTLAKLEALRDRALHCADADAEAFARLNALWKLPTDNAKRQAEFPAAVLAATDVPLGVLRDSTEMLRLLKSLCGTTNHMLNSDLAIAAICAASAGRAAAWNVRINLPSIEDRESASRIDSEVKSLLGESASLLAHVTTYCGSAAEQAD